MPVHRRLTYAYVLSGGLIWEQTFSSPWENSTSHPFPTVVFFWALAFQSHRQMYDWLLAVHVSATVSLSEKSFLWTPFLSLYSVLLPHVYGSVLVSLGICLFSVFLTAGLAPLRKREDLASGVFWVCSITCCIVSAQRDTYWNRVEECHNTTWEEGCCVITGSRVSLPGKPHWRKGT